MAPELDDMLRTLGRRIRSRANGLVGRHEEAAILWARTIPGWFLRSEIRLLYRTVSACSGPGDIAEIGSWKGRSTVVIGRAIRDAGLGDCRIFAIDPHVGSEEHREVIAREGSTLETFRRNVRAARVEDLVEEIVMPSLDAAQILGDRGIRLRMVFIDGAHDAESVRRDIRAFVPLLHPGAPIALHDCSDDANAPFPGVWQAYCEELQPRVEDVARADSLLVARLRSSAS